MLKILLIDNDDSFTYNLEHLLVACSRGEVLVAPYSQSPWGAVSEYDLVVISPGPGAPRDYPDYHRLFSQPCPVLGICLGMQIINEHFGGATDRLPGCVHGKTDVIEFADATFTVARYHSLYASVLAPELNVLAQNHQGAPMALRHQHRPILGFQFHPESFLTTKGDFFIRYALQTLLEH